MAKQIFKGFKQLSAAAFSGITPEVGVLYFIRTSEAKEDGFLYFNGKKYGTAKDADSELKELLGELPSGETSFASWIEKEVAARISEDERLDSAITLEAAARTAADSSLLGDATADTTSNATIYDVKRHADSLALSAHTHENKAVLDGISAEKVSAWDAAEQNAKNYADSKIAEAVEGLDAAASAVSADETIASISEENGIISASKQKIAIAHTQVTDWDTELNKKQDNLVFTSTYDPEQNRVVTEREIKILEGAMHFVGISSTDPAQGATISGHTGEFKAGDVCLFGVKEFIYDGTKWNELGDEGLYVTKTTTIAGVDLQDNITKEDLLQALNVEDGAQVNKLEKVKVNGSELTIDGNKAVNVTVTSGSSNGTIAVNGTDVEVTGFNSEISRLESAITDAQSAATKYTDDKVAALDAVVSGVSADGVSSVQVTEVDGVVTAVAVEHKISAGANNAIEAKADGLFAAIYYEDDDNA